MAPTNVPLQVRMCALDLPDPRDWRIQNFLYHAEKGQVVYRAEKAEACRYSLFGDPNLSAGARRHIEVFEPLDFLAEITQHIPDPGMRLVRYFGWYSKKTRGQRKKADCG